MAYDGHTGSDPYQTGNMNSDPNDPHSYTPYHSYYGANIPQPMPPTAAPAPNVAYPEPPRPPPQNTGSINDAISSAVHQADAAYLSPEVLSQITATVIQQLKASGLENLQPPGPPPPRPYSQQPAWLADPGSPPMASQSNTSVPPNPAPSFVDTYTPYAAARYADTRPSPKPSPVSVVDRDIPSPSQSSERSQKTESRPKPPSRDATVTEMTTLEKIWGKLFEDGRPTKRLGQFLRGVAVHLVDNHRPCRTKSY